MVEGTFSGVEIADVAATDGVIDGVVVDESRGGRADGPAWSLFVESGCDPAEMLVDKLGNG